MISENFDLNLTIITGPFFACETLQCISKFILFKISSQENLIEVIPSPRNEESAEHKRDPEELSNKHALIGSVIVYISIKMYLVLQGLLICLKADELVDWEWLQVLWATWVLIAFLIGLTLGILCVFFLKLAGFLFGNDLFKEGKTFFSSFFLSEMFFCFFWKRNKV